MLYKRKDGETTEIGFPECGEAVLYIKCKKIVLVEKEYLKKRLPMIKIGSFFYKALRFQLQTMPPTITGMERQKYGS